MNSHHSSRMKSDTYITPKWLVDAVGPFDLDPCTPPDMPWQTAAQRYAKKEDGLKSPWFGRVWLNPPFGKYAVEWMLKMAEHNNGIALLLARTETVDWHTSVWAHADGILFLKGRIHFHYPDGTRLDANCGAPPVLISYGEENTTRLQESGLPGKFLPVNYTPVIVVGVSPSWFSVTCIAIRRTGSDQDLKPIYDQVELMAPEKVGGNKHWKEKVRQQIQRYRQKQIA